MLSIYTGTSGDFAKDSKYRNCRDEVKGTRKSTMISAQDEVENQVSQRSRGLAKYEQAQWWPGWWWKKSSSLSLKPKKKMQNVDSRWV